MTKEDAINIFKEQFCGIDVYCEIHQYGLCLTDECEIWWANKALEQYKADAVEVVRCKDCKWYEEYRIGAITMSDKTDYISRQEALKAIKFAEPDCEYEAVEAVPPADVQPHQLTEEDLTELRHRFGNKVERVVRDMISGKEERWMT